MTNIYRFCAPVLFLLTTTCVFAQGGAPTLNLSSAQIVDFWVKQQEIKLVAAAEAMPADKYAFRPTGGEFEGVRTFAEQLKHLAATNYILGAGILQQPPPDDAGDETGPATLRTKADVLQYLRTSFAYLHEAVATIDDKNAVLNTPPISPLPKDRATRLGLSIELLMHTNDHYGQIIEYLRMNGIVPPASRLDGAQPPRS